MDLRKNNLINGVLYGLVSIATIVGEVKGMQTVVYVCKPLMMIVLSSWFYFNSRRVGDRFTLLIQAGLFFSLVGDIALMLEHMDEFNFLIGLGAFLIAQLCYTFAFAHNISESPGGQGLLVSSALGVCIILYGVWFGNELIDSVDDTVVLPVGIYAFAITVMGVAASFRFARTFLPSFILVFIGAAFFITSDSILATSRFLRPVDHAPWSVLSTYAIAQYLIARGCLRHVLDPAEIRRKAALDAERLN